MKKFTPIFVMVWFTQLIGIIMWGEYVWLTRFSIGGVGGTPMEKVRPIFWIILIIELLWFIYVVLLEKKERGTNNE